MTPDRRTKHLTRKLISLTLHMREIGVFDTRSAAEHMRKYGVPMSVALATLAHRNADQMEVA